MCLCKYCQTQSLCAGAARAELTVDLTPHHARVMHSIPAAKSRLYFQFMATEAVTSPPPNLGSTKFYRTLINTLGWVSAGYMHYSWRYGYRKASLSPFLTLQHSPFWNLIYQILISIGHEFQSSPCPQKIRFCKLGCLIFKNVFVYLFFYRAEHRVCLF